MTDLDDIHRAIDDEIYAQGKELRPPDGVRRAIARRRLLQRSAVAGSAALVAAAAVVAVTVISNPARTTPGPIAGSATGATGATGATAATAATAASSTPAAPTPVPVLTQLATSGGPPSPNPGTAIATTELVRPTGRAALPNGLGGVLAGVQWNGTHGALVAVDAKTGAVVHTYTTGITNSSYDVLRSGTEAYFVATVDARGCATHWSGIDLITGNPVAAPAALNARPIQAAAVAPDAEIVTAQGTCGGDHSLLSYRKASATESSMIGQGDERQLTISADGADLAYIYTGPPALSTDSPATTAGKEVTSILMVRGAFGMDPNSANVLPTLPDGCTPTALAYAGTDLAAGVTCAQNDGTPVLTVLRWDRNGTLVMRKDTSTPFKRASISDIAVQDDAIYYVVNAEGVEAHLYRLGEEKTDPELAQKLWHIAAPP